MVETGKHILTDEERKIGQFSEENPPKNFHKGKRLSTLLREALSKGIPVTVTMPDGSRKEVLVNETEIIKSLATQAMGGKNKVAAIKEIFDRLEGKPPQAIILDGELKATGIPIVEWVKTEKDDAK